MTVKKAVKKFIFNWHHTVFNCDIIMYIFLIIIKITVICCFNLNESTYKLRAILNEYKNHSLGKNATKFAENALDFFKKTERYQEFLKYYRLSDCPQAGDNVSSQYISRHILNGLIIDPMVPEKHWNEYKSVFNKSYVSSGEEKCARDAWQGNLNLVASHNQKFLRGTRSYSLHLNVLGDLHPDDYTKKILKLIKTFPLFDPHEDKHKTTYHINRLQRAPRRVDWREKGYRPKREEQWKCGACYAFAVTHALQAQMFKKHRRWKELSPQQIVDCSGSDGNFGCQGGSLRATMRYAAREGLIPEIEYPYFGMKGRCRYNKRRVKARPKRWAMIPFGDERGMERALANIGPLAVAINASPRSFQLYRSGIYDDPFCTPFRLNHAMLLVGYTPEYWILLNWWGRRWGEDGYMRIRRGLNRCGVANMAAYVEIV